MNPLRQSRIFVDPSGRRWAVHLTGWGTAMAGDVRNRTDQPDVRVLTFESDGEVRRNHVPYDTPHLERWTESQLLAAFGEAS